MLQSAFIIRARLDEWRSVFDLALRAARLAKNRAGEAGILSGLGVARQHADSLRYLQQVLEIQRELGTREGEARAQYNLALSTTWRSRSGTTVTRNECMTMPWKRCGWCAS